MAGPQVTTFVDFKLSILREVDLVHPRCHAEQGCVGTKARMAQKPELGTEPREF